MEKTDVFRRTKTSASIQRTLPPPCRSMTSMGTASTASTEAYSRAYLCAGSARCAVADIDQDAHVAEVFVPGAELEHVAGEGGHLRVVDGQQLVSGVEPAGNTRPRSAASMLSSATTAMRVPMLMTTLVW